MALKHYILKIKMRAIQKVILSLGFLIIFVLRCVWSAFFNIDHQYLFEYFKLLAFAKQYGHVIFNGTFKILRIYNILNLTITNWRLFWNHHMKPYRILGGHSKKIDTLFGCTIPGWYRLIVLEKPAQLFGRFSAAVRLVDIEQLAAASTTPCAYVCVMVHQNQNSNQKGWRAVAAP